VLENLRDLPPFSGPPIVREYRSAFQSAAKARRQGIDTQDHVYYSRFQVAHSARSAGLGSTYPAPVLSPVITDSECSVRPHRAARWRSTLENRSPLPRKGEGPGVRAVGGSARTDPVGAHRAEPPSSRRQRRLANRPRAARPPVGLAR
jgi:hypothetical protein